MIANRLKQLYWLWLLDTEWYCSEHGKHNQASLLRFRNIHAGERCVIMGNGPSLKTMDYGLLRDEITFGLNRIYLHFPVMGFASTYHVCVNELVIDQCYQEMDKLDTTRFINWSKRNLFYTV